MGASSRQNSLELGSQRSVSCRFRASSPAGSQRTLSGWGVARVALGGFLWRQRKSMFPRMLVCLSFSPPVPHGLWVRCCLLLQRGNIAPHLFSVPAFYLHLDFSGLGTEVRLLRNRNSLARNEVTLRDADARALNSTLELTPRSPRPGRATFRGDNAVERDRRLP